jgi:polysaccharide export outer membrane protein
LVDPIVNISFLNYRVTVLGEVGRPTVISVANEKISLLEALGLAGDLTIYARRDNVLLIREENNKKIIRRINLNTDEIFKSPYYYLKTNDVVYVEPNKSKVANTGRAQVLLPVLFSALSLVTIIVSYYR